jgi:hypothetical protein
LDPLIYFLAEYFPWWGIPSILILGEIANHFRRVGQKVRFILTALVCLLMVVLCIAYFTNDGFRNLRPAMQNLEKQYK